MVFTLYGLVFLSFCITLAVRSKASPQARQLERLAWIVTFGLPVPLIWCAEHDYAGATMVMAALGTLLNGLFTIAGVYILWMHLIGALWQRLQRHRLRRSAQV
jgi:hypothetical protein